MLNKYDRIAWIYDVLAGFAFLGSIKKSQRRFLERIQNGDKVLILGGGTGWILNDIFSVAPAAKVHFIEASQKMLIKAGKRAKAFDVEFFHGTEQSIPLTEYDVVITNFFLDQFTDRELDKVIGLICSTIKPGGKWIATDFVNRSTWHSFILRLMYKFFQLTVSLTNSSLPSWNEMLSERLDVVSEKEKFYGGFIEAHIYNLNK